MTGPAPGASSKPLLAVVYDPACLSYIRNGAAARNHPSCIASRSISPIYCRQVFYSLRMVQLIRQKQGIYLSASI